MIDITRDNVDQLLDANVLFVHMASGRWWNIRRNGKTMRWARTPERLRVPFKAGMCVYGAITSKDFIGNSVDSNHIRHKDDIQPELMP